MSLGQYKHEIIILVLGELFYVLQVQLRSEFIYSGSVLHLGVHFSSLCVFLWDGVSGSGQAYEQHMETL